MIKARKAHKATPIANGRSKNETEPAGEGWQFCIARGLFRWRRSQGLNRLEAVRKYGVDKNDWYRIEKGFFPGTTGTKIDQLCQAIGVKFIELYNLGL